MNASIIQSALNSVDHAGNAKHWRTSGKKLSNSMKIIRKLPPIPRPATKTVKDPRYYSYGTHTFAYTPHISGWEDPVVRETARRVQEQRTSEARERYKLIIDMACRGASDIEIAKETGYRRSTVNNLIWQFRREGIQIPPRKKGPK